MENAEQNPPTSDEDWGPFQLKANPRALFKLSLGTAAAIATALLIPDAVALIPNVPNGFVWFCRCLGLWGYAYVLWTTGFLCLLHLVRIFGGSIVLDSSGIKLGRMGAKIPWSSIKAISISERKVFSRIFFTPAYQMNLHTMKPDGKYASKQLASFQYLPEEFYTLFYYISKNSVGVEPASLQACVFTDAAKLELKKSAEQARWKSIVLTAVISFGLVSYLGRKAAVNYEFNVGKKYFEQIDYEKAATHFSNSTAIDFTFAPGWDRLARSEFRLGDIPAAEEHWKTALKWKPDFVEAKLGLSNIYMLRGQLEEAEKIIASANRLAKYDEAAYINRAQIDALTGKTRLAISELESFIKQANVQGQGRNQAICMLARCYVREGQAEKARKLLDANPQLADDPYVKTFYALVTAELKLGQRDWYGAERVLRPYMYIVANQQPEFLVAVARIECARRNVKVAKELIARAESINPTSPWVAIAGAEVASGMNDLKTYDVYTTKALGFRYEDPCVLGACAVLRQRQFRTEEAIALAKRALALDPDNLDATKVILFPTVSRL